MPKQTFLNLPQEKQDLLLQAARNEFSRVPFAEASINKIILQAGISRGSFYMYFEDKSDLFRYIMEQYTMRLYESLERLLLLCQGDLLKTFSQVFEESISQGDQLEQGQLVSIIRRNMGLEQQGLLQNLSCELIHTRLLPLIDRSKLRLRCEEELPHILTILFRITGPMLFLALTGPAAAQVQRDYQLELDILSRGLSAPQDIEEAKKGD